MHVILQPYKYTTMDQIHEDLCLYLHTVVAHGAVRAARRSVETAGGAPLHPNLNASDLHRLVERSTEIILFIFVLVSCNKQTHRDKRTGHLSGQTYLFIRANVSKFSMKIHIKHFALIPLGKMPGSIKVAIQKLANTNRNIMPLYIGTATENCSESQGHLKERQE